MADQEKLDFIMINALSPVDMSHSGKAEFEAIERNDTGEALISPMPKGRLAC